MTATITAPDTSTVPVLDIRVAVLAAHMAALPLAALLREQDTATRRAATATGPLTRTLHQLTADAAALELLTR